MRACFSVISLVMAVLACGGGGGTPSDAGMGSDAAELVGPDKTGDFVLETDVNHHADSVAEVVGGEVEPDTPADQGSNEPPQPGACCASDAECQGGLVCAKQGAGLGVCEPKPEGDECWDSSDCPEDHLCEGAVVCPCDADCPVPDQPGTCRVIPGCCSSDADCGGGPWHCITTPEGALGVCKFSQGLGEGECWWDYDCDPWWVCQGAEVCPCGYSCDTADEPGKCVLGGGCCLSDDDCGEPDMSCVPTGEEFGICKSSKNLEKGQCWTDADCGLGVCEGVVVCPCNADCDLKDTPGTCRLPSGCCLVDEDCGEGPWSCVDVGYEYGICRHANELGEGECWIQADCASEGMFCVGAFIPSCAEPMPLVVGTCVLVPEGCCGSDADCGEDQVCRGLSPSLPGRCVVDPRAAPCPDGAVCCWQDSDCPEGQVCQGASVCGCIVLCPECGDCAPDQMGVCGG